MRVATIIQARMGSTRLPGKVLADLGGRSVLARVIERALAIPGCDVVVCAAPDAAGDDPVAEEAAREAVRPSDREHVSPFIREHPDARRMNMPGPGPETVRHRWTLDHADDLTFLRALWPRLPEGPAGWDWRVPFGIVEADPVLAGINAGHDRLEGYNRSLEQDAKAGFS